MSHKLDENRPYGSLSPSHRGAQYEQDGNYFGPSKEFRFSINPVTGVESRKYLTPEMVEMDKKAKANKTKNRVRR